MTFTTALELGNIYHLDATKFYIASLVKEGFEYSQIKLHSDEFEEVCDFVYTCQTLTEYATPFVFIQEIIKRLKEGQKLVVVINQSIGTFVDEVIENM